MEFIFNYIRCFVIIISWGWMVVLFMWRIIVIYILILVVVSLERVCI